MEMAMGLFLADFFRDLWRKVDGFIAGFGLNQNYLAQIGHFSVTYALVFSAFVDGWVFNFWYAGLIVAAVIGGPWVYWKEYRRDPRPPENAPFWPGKGMPFLASGLCDASFYWLGALMATLHATAIGMAFPR